MKAATIGYIMLTIYYVLYMYQVLATGDVSLMIFAIFLPIITIPMNIFANLLTDFAWGMVDVIWIVVGFYLIAKDN